MSEQTTPPSSPSYAEQAAEAAAVLAERTGVERHDVALVMGSGWLPAVDALGEVVFFDPPAVGATVTKDESYAEVESVKAVSDVIAPLSGEIVEVNTALGDSPETINDDPYGEGWMFEIQVTEASEVEELIDAEAYAATLD